MGFRVHLEPTDTPEEYLIYVADVLVDHIWTDTAKEAMEEYFRYEEILFRCADPDTDSPTSTELNILSCFDRLSQLLRI